MCVVSAPALTVSQSLPLKGFTFIYSHLVGGGLFLQHKGSRVDSIPGRLDISHGDEVLRPTLGLLGEDGARAGGGGVAAGGNGTPWGLLW